MKQKRYMLLFREEVLMQNRVMTLFMEVALQIRYMQVMVMTR